MSSSERLAGGNAIDSNATFVGFDAVSGGEVRQAVDGEIISSALEAAGGRPNTLDINGVSVQLNSVTELEEHSIGGIVVLTPSSPGGQLFSSDIIPAAVALPDTSLLTVGEAYYFINSGDTATVSLTTFTAVPLSPIGVIPGGVAAHVVCISTADNLSSSWNVSLHANSAGTVDSVTVGTPLDLVISASSGPNIELNSLVQAENTVFAGPRSGADDDPGFRLMQHEDFRATGQVNEAGSAFFDFSGFHGIAQNGQTASPTWGAGSAPYIINSSGGGGAMAASNFDGALVSRDQFGNVCANNFIQSSWWTSTTSGVQLNPDSPRLFIITDGALFQPAWVNLPHVKSIPIGTQYQIVNYSQVPVPVAAYANSTIIKGTTIQIIQPTAANQATPTATFTVISDSKTSGGIDQVRAWAVSYSMQNADKDASENNTEDVEDQFDLKDADSGLTVDKKFGKVLQVSSSSSGFFDFLFGAINTGINAYSQIGMKFTFSNALSLFDAGIKTADGLSTLYKITSGHQVNGRVNSNTTDDYTFEEIIVTEKLVEHHNWVLSQDTADGVQKSSQWQDPATLPGVVATISGEGILLDSTPIAPDGSNNVTLVALSHANSAMLIANRDSGVFPGIGASSLPSFRSLDLGDLDFSSIQSLPNSVVTRDNNQMFEIRNAIYPITGVDTGNITIEAYAMNLLDRKKLRVRTSASGTGTINLPDVTQTIFETATYGGIITGISCIGLEYEIINESAFQWTIGTFTDVLGTTAGDTIIVIDPQASARVTCVSPLNTVASWVVDVEPAPKVTNYLLQSKGVVDTPVYDVTYASEPAVPSATPITETTLVQYDSSGVIVANNLVNTCEELNNLAAEYQIIPFTSTITNNAFEISPNTILLTGTPVAKSIILPFTNQGQANSLIGGAEAAACGQEWTIVNRTNFEISVYTFDYTNYVAGAPPTFTAGHFLMNIPRSNNSTTSNVISAASTTFRVSGTSVVGGKDLRQNWTYTIASDFINLQASTLAADITLTAGAPFVYELDANGGDRIVTLPSVNNNNIGTSYTIKNTELSAPLGLNQPTLIVQSFAADDLQYIPPGCSAVFTTRSISTESFWTVDIQADFYKEVHSFGLSTFTPKLQDAVPDTTTYVASSQVGYCSTEVDQIDEINVSTRTNVTSRFTPLAYESTTNQNLQIQLPLPSGPDVQTVLVHCMQGDITGATPTFTQHVVPMTIAAGATFGTTAMNFTGVDGGNDTWFANYQYRSADFI